MSWKIVFNTNLKFGHGFDLKGVGEFAKQAGYEYFTHNGSVYNVNLNKVKGITIDDLF